MSKRERCKNGSNLICEICHKPYEYKRHKGNSTVNCSSCIVNKRRIRVKIQAIEYLGGKCKRCGYAKCWRSMHFHHLQPKEKDFSISSAYYKPWSQVLPELDKCVLLCANCHGEAEEEINTSPLKLLTQAQRLASVRITKNGAPCKVCGSPTKNKGGCCSNKCFAFTRRKVERPSREVLERDIKDMSLLAVGRKYGVSDNAIRKWLR